MRKGFSILLSTIMAVSCFNAAGIASVSADEEVITVTADKTAQWIINHSNTGADLSIHGYTDYAREAYVGFTLPEGFSADDLSKAVIKLYTKSCSRVGNVNIYPTNYSAFGNGQELEGEEARIADDGTSLKTFQSSTANVEIDVTDYMASLAGGTENVAFHIAGVTGKKTENSHAWVIGSCTNGGPAPELVLTMGEGGYISNSRFKKGTDGWSVSGSVTADSENSLVELKGTSSISQQLTGIESGKYDLHARVKNDNWGNKAYVYAKANGHPIMKTSASVTSYINNNGWRDIYVRGVNIDRGECEIGLVLGQLDAGEVRVYEHIPDEPLPDGNGKISIDSFELIEAPDSNDSFLVGGDINFLTFLEDKGVRYFDTDGTERDAVQIMAENGANIVRLRLYNDPGKGHGDGTDYLPAGYQDPEDILALAKRAKEKGMQIQLTFHYSDYWTNANDQLMPHEWKEAVDALGADATQDEKDEKVEECLYNFTKDFMERMKSQGTEPEYISFGNEMHTGLLFSKGRKEYDYGSTYRWSRLASLLKTAYRAAKEVSPDTKVELHLDGAGNRTKYKTFFTNCKNYDVPYDVIGISYYPYWYPEYDVSALVDFCDYLVNTFDKDIMFLETGYSFVDKSLIGGQDTRFTNVGPYQDTFGQSKLGQKAFMEELYSGLKQTIGGRCLGDLYWDPIMIKHEGVGWAYKEKDDTIEHNKNISITLFDTDGFKLPAQSVFEDNGYIPDTVTVSGKITGIEAGGCVKLIADGKEYSVVPDRFGEYVLRLPYEDEINITAEKDAANTYSIDMTMTSAAKGIDFEVSSETAEPTAAPTTAPTTAPTAEPTVAPTTAPTTAPTAEPTGVPSQGDVIDEISAGYDSEGNITYSVGFNAQTVGAVLYTAVYDSDGRLIAIRKDTDAGEVAVTGQSGAYTVAAFLWSSEGEPLCDMKSETVVFEEEAAE